MGKTSRRRAGLSAARPPAESLIIVVSPRGDIDVYDCHSYYYYYIRLYMATEAVFGFKILHTVTATLYLLCCCIAARAAILALYILGNIVDEQILGGRHYSFSSARFNVLPNMFDGTCSR
jgi:hypothetical protein